ncbi:aminotransferase class V-fold PLP-dependent enzyme [Candidatus Viadribacter manganicus]|uniref:Cysteine desulfurase n=1 Tax=Candidatus Viadribacter manganicus TaxID=1759059 RepID=A0A1B1AMT0_9PROT|nr:cysteine desulfurase [Candidatus Viadribacter manganicus]ANP47882.1 cysteine desulfurase [Candidatus Viadribacter manganicus]
MINRPFEIDAVRAQFAILEREVNGRPLVYLDSAASAQKPEAVIEAMAAQMRGAYANVHRGLHTLANETTEAFEAARHTVAQFINAPSPESIVFTKGGTQAINIVAAGLEIKPGDEIVLSVMEHHSNIVPWHFLRERKGAVLKWLDIDDNGGIDLAALEALIGRRTKFVAITHMSNVLGAKTPAAQIARIAHAGGAKVMFDGCQATVHGRVDVQAIDADFYAFTGHKLYGPTGIGVLYGKRDLLAEMVPFEGGGEMIDVVERERVTYNEPPHRFEAGTPPIIEAVGLKAAIDWLSTLDRTALEKHEAALRDRAMDALRELNWVTLHGAASDKGAIVAFSVEGAHPHDVAQILDRQGVAIRAGHHCAQPLMQRLGVTATARASFACYNRLEEVDALVEALHKARKLLS